MTVTADRPKPSRGTALAGARAELATLTMWAALGAGIVPTTELSPPG